MQENSASQNPNPDPCQEIADKLDYNTPEDQRLLTVLFRKIENMEQKLHDLETKKIIDETQLSPEMLENSGLLPQKPTKLKRGRGYRPILQSEIEEAKTHSPFAAGQARWLGINLQTFRKYAKLYGIYEPKPTEKGKRNLFDPNRGKYPLTKILAGEFNDMPAISDWRVKDKLIRSGIVLPQCNICGYNKRRIVDNKICLLLDHKDGNIKNYKLDNLQLLCFNCTFECGRGYIRRGNHTFDPDWMQCATKHELDSRPRW